MKIELFIPGPPPTVTHQEKKVTVVRGKPRFYEPAELKAARALFRDWAATKTPEQPMRGAVELTVSWYFPATYAHRPGTPKITKPDTDNLMKLLKDCLTAAHWWVDDAQVWKERSAKVYSDLPGVYIVAEETWEEETG